MPPRHTKSEFASTFFPSFIMGKKPKMKIMQTTHTGELAVRFGRKVRNLMDQKEYKDVFPEVKLQADNKSAGRWETNKGGEYFAAGVGGAVTGRGADYLLLMTLIQSKTLLALMLWNLLGNGIPLDLDSVYSLVEL